MRPDQAAYFRSPVKPLRIRPAAVLGVHDPAGDDLRNGLVLGDAMPFHGHLLETLPRSPLLYMEKPGVEGMRITPGGDRAEKNLPLGRESRRHRFAVR
jgi:hypothetical protein